MVDHDRAMTVDTELQLEYGRSMPRSRLVTAMTFGERVRGMRKAKSLTLRALAGRVGVNFTYLSKIECGSLVAIHPESDPWHGAWQLGVGDVLKATVVRWVENADRCGDAGGYLLALRPAALVMLCGQEAGRFESGERVAVTVTSIDPRHGKVTVGLR